jgi:hypothetical protein
MTFTSSSGAYGSNTFSISANQAGLLSSVRGSDITTQANANSAIGAVDSALAQVNGGRAEIGATINRLTYAADNLTNVSTNTSASRSRVQDTDFAKASTELARTQIIAQAARPCWPRPTSRSKACWPCSSKQRTGPATRRWSGGLILRLNQMGAGPDCATRRTPRAWHTL